MDIKDQANTIIDNEPVKNNQSPKDIIVNNIVEINNAGREDYSHLRRIRNKLLEKIEGSIDNMSQADTIKLFNQLSSNMHDYIELNNDLVKQNNNQQSIILQTPDNSQSGLDAFTKSLSNEDMQKLDTMLKIMQGIGVEKK